MLPRLESHRVVVVGLPAVGSTYFVIARFGFVELRGRLRAAQELVKPLRRGCSLKAGW